MLRHQASRYIPQNARPLVHPDGLGVVYAYETRQGKLAAIAYRGTAAKSTWHYSLNGMSRVYEKAAEFFADLESHEVRKAERRAESNQPHSLFHGEIVYNSWGYDQTNIDFYVIEKVSANYAWLHEIASTCEETGFMCGNTEPVLPVQKITERHGETIKPTMHKVTMYNGAPSINFKYGCGCLWNGKPGRCSWYA